MTQGVFDWLAAHADALDRGGRGSPALLPELVRAGLTGVGVPPGLGGQGGDVADAIEAIASVAQRSLTAAFVLWGHRTFIEYLLASDNDALRERWLPDLQEGRIAGATGLSNAMKFLSGVEQLQIEAEPCGDAWRLSGKMPWVTNLHPEGFVVAAAVARVGAPAAIVAIESGAQGVRRSPDLDLIALRGSHTAAIELDRVLLRSDSVLAEDGTAFLKRVRPAFLGMQCGLSIGLARASLTVVEQASAGHRHALNERVTRTRDRLAQTEAALIAGVRSGRFVGDAASLFKLRLALADVAQEACNLELMTAGGRAYLSAHSGGFDRRWREAAFIPIVTPSVSQLEAELHKHRSANEGATA